MSEAFRNAVLVYLSQADLIHDRFHVAMMLSQAVDKTRQEASRAQGPSGSLDEAEGTI